MNDTSPKDRVSSEAPGHLQPEPAGPRWPGRGTWKSTEKRDSGTPRWRTATASSQQCLPATVLPGALRERRGRWPSSEAAHLEMVMVKVRRRTTLGRFTPYTALPVLESNKTDFFSFKGGLKQSWDRVDYLRGPGAHMGHHRQGGRTLTVQWKHSSCGPRAGQSWTTFWQQQLCLVPHTARCALLPSPAPQLTMCLASTDEARPQQRQTSPRSCFCYYKRRKGQGDTKRKRHVRNAKDTIDEKTK